MCLRLFRRHGYRVLSDVIVFVLALASSEIAEISDGKLLMGLLLKWTPLFYFALAVFKSAVCG